MIVSGAGGHRSELQDKYDPEAEGPVHSLTFNKLHNQGVIPFEPFKYLFISYFVFFCLSVYKNSNSVYPLPGAGTHESKLTNQTKKALGEY